VPPEELALNVQEQGREEKSRIPFAGWAVRLNFV
jgi:hypothetical protein